MPRKPHIVVIGAGSFGGWTALHLLQHARVTLLDAWGPGNSRASSGGETRVMRGTYGPDQPYTELAARALKLWTKYERQWKRQFLHRTGVLWMASGDDSYERGSIAPLRDAKIKFQQLSDAQMKKRWPQINFDSIEWGIFEPDCGYLDARASCQAVVEAFQSAGGTYRQLAVLPGQLEVENDQVATARRTMWGQPPSAVQSSKARQLFLSDGSQLKADIYVFACGPWLGQLFPRTIGPLIQPTKQDIFFFGSPAGDDRFTDRHLPVWGDHRDHFFYGIPGSLSGDARRGFKIADDTRGPAFDPTHGERIVNPATLQHVREYVAFRFPALKDAPLVETRVCQYEQTPDGHFILDRHPAHENVWILGGGSGHGFKHGPALGERMSTLILKDEIPDPNWRLDRFDR
ncbi:MAG TPA: FAD-dependent oxidoreductase [Candidatus Sulfotelmatobacter sp.]|nr:FAD-dependent oxidoreductase [Candidatus Sulfotelmatobacter sp.]